MNSVIDPRISQRWQPVAIDDVVVRERVREISPQHVAELLKSYEQLGGQLQLQPIVVDVDLVLIDGAHRLAAAKAAGWSHISALVFDGVTVENRTMLEVEANRVRVNLTPAELERVWTTYYEPAIRERARKRKLARLKQGAEASVIGDYDNGDSSRSLTVVKAAKQTTGLSIDTLRKISQIRSVAESPAAPSQLQSAAEKAMAQLARPDAQVDPVYRKLMRQMQSFGSADSSEQRSSKSSSMGELDRALRETTLLSERLMGRLATELELAAKNDQVAAEQLRAVRVALATSLAIVVAVECEITEDPRTALAPLGIEVSRLLSQTTRARLRASELARHRKEQVQ